MRLRHVNEQHLNIKRARPSNVRTPPAGLNFQSQSLLDATNDTSDDGVIITSHGAQKVGQKRQKDMSSCENYDGPLAISARNKSDSRPISIEQENDVDPDVWSRLVPSLKDEDSTDGFNSPPPKQQLVNSISLTVEYPEQSAHLRVWAPYLDNLKSRMNALVQQVSDLRFEETLDMSEADIDDSDSSWYALQSEEDSAEDSVSTSDSSKSWVTVPNHGYNDATKGKDKQYSDQGLSASSGPSRQNGKRKLPVGGDNPNDQNDDDWDKIPRRPSDQLDADRTELPGKSIPCFIDGCRGKDKYFSHLF